MQSPSATRRSISCFFVGVIGYGVVFQHPAYLIIGAAVATAFYLLLAGRQGLRRMLGLLPLLVLAALVIRCAALGATAASFTPELAIAPVAGINAVGLAVYGAYLFIPTILHCKEAIQWHTLRSNI